MKIPSSCPVCGHAGVKIRDTNSSLKYECICPRCGTYQTDSDFVTSKRNSDFETKKHLLSGLLRETYETTEKAKGLSVYDTELETLLSDGRIPLDSDIDGKKRKIVEAIRRKSNNTFATEVRLDMNDDFSLAYAQNKTQFIALIKELQQSEYVNIIHSNTVETEQSDVPVTANMVVALSSKGWKETEAMGEILFG